MSTEIESQEQNIAITNENIVSLISVGEWGEVLRNLANDMDPWDVDLAVLNKRLTEHIEHMRRLDLRIPAKILLAAAIIYKLKSEAISAFEEEAVPEEELFSDDFVVDEEMPVIDKNIVIPPIQLPLQRAPRRKITLDELVHALDKAMNIKTRREAREFFQIDLAGADLSKNIEELYEKICTFVLRGEQVTFSGLLGIESTKENKIRAFNSMLHLASQGKIVCSQTELFGEIQIRGVENA
ncbi:MAG: hypothetical protein KAJ91_00285 [Candidatus Aenigmarchaeota archaeon]|nr:hypothetical protein [Candidatus Aenigmarchaeota archaeon]MCK5333596.1 hypothetical protein [Candidatus Aenigmarchaeota archaeon]